MEPQKQPSLEKIKSWVNNHPSLSVIGILVILGYCTSFTMSNNSGALKNTQNQPVQQMVFDMPSLIGKNILEVKSMLGKPEIDTEPTPQQVKLGMTEWEKSYSKDGFGLLVTYDVKSKKVKDVFLSTNDSEGTTQNTDKLLKAGNLTLGQQNYSIKFIEALKKPGYYTGVLIK